MATGVGEESRVVRRREAEREWLPWFVPTGGFAVVALLTMVFLFQYALLIRSHYQVVTLKDRQRHLAREKELMELQLQELSSLERVEKLATQRLGMVPPLQRQVLDLRKLHGMRQVAATAAAKN